MDELIELQQKTKGRKGFIDFSNSEDIALMGKQLLLTEVDHSYGKPMPTVYYEEGLNSFDAILNGYRDYEVGLTFHMACFLNAFVFILYHPSGSIQRVGVWRHRLIKHKTQENVQVKVLKENRATNMLKSGIYGRGVAGILSSIAIGKTLEKIQGIQSKVIDGVKYQLYILDENDNEVTVSIHCDNKHKYQLSMFILTSFPEHPESTNIKLNTKSCYIATVCYGDTEAKEVRDLRWYRDSILNRHTFSRAFVEIYYFISPFLLKFFKPQSIITKIVRNYILSPMVRVIQRKRYEITNNKK